MKLDSIGILFTNSWRRLQEHFAPAIQIFLAPAVLILISGLLFARRTQLAMGLGAVIGLIEVIASILAALALVSLFGKGTDLASSYRTAFKLFWSAIWVIILVVLAVIGGYTLLIIPGIMLALQLSFATYTLVLEDKRGIGALTLSREYIKGYWWAFLGRSLLLVLCLGAAMLVLFLPASLLLGFVGGQIVYVALLILFVPFSVSYQYEIYENLRRLKPDAVEVAAKAELGFLKAVMVIGIFSGFIFAALLIFGIATTQWNAPYPGGYYNPGGPDIPVGGSGYYPSTTIATGTSSSTPAPAY